MKKVFITGIYAILLLGGASLQAMDISPIDVEVTLQNRKITGTIVDQNGEPIIGANVLQKGTTNGTITNIDGCFTVWL